MQNQKSNKKSKTHIPRNPQTKQPTAATNAAASAAEAAVEAFQSSDSGPIQTDVLGSYTGLPADPTDPKPEQDADDL